MECYYDHQVPGKTVSGSLLAKCSGGNVAPFPHIVLSLYYLILWRLNLSYLMTSFLIFTLRSKFVI